MILLEGLSGGDLEETAILLFGAGLIGTSITKNFGVNVATHNVPFDWNDRNRTSSDSSAINTTLTHLVESRSLTLHPINHIAVIWSAGKAGFFASKEDVALELETFHKVLELVQSISNRNPDCRIAFHHMSSAGGLFENQGCIDETTSPAPVRFYGHLKYEQEQALIALDKAISKFIYRPTSVYGYNGLGKRMGLIPTLISNGLKNRTTTIFGSLSTLRDYVLNDDIGQQVVNNLVRPNSTTETTVELLATGKPSSILEIRYFVEQLIRKKIYLNFVNSPETNNTTDITVNPSALPISWKPTDVKTGIRYVKEYMSAS